MADSQCQNPSEVDLFADDDSERIFMISSAALRPHNCSADRTSWDIPDTETVKKTARTSSLSTASCD
jgi:hypothetical protein